MKNPHSRNIKGCAACPFSMGPTLAARSYPAKGANRAVRLICCQRGAAVLIRGMVCNSCWTPWARSTQALRRNPCQEVREYCEPTVGRWVFKATVYQRRSSKGFVGYGDADPSNVSSMVRGADCASPRLAPSIAPCARPTGLASARSKSWVRSRLRRDLPPFPRRRMVPSSNGRATANPGSAISSAF